MAENDKEKTPKATGKSHFLSRFMITVAVLIVILGVTLFLAVRTDGGRTMIQDWLGKKLGMTLTIRDTTMELPFVLVMEGISSKENDPLGKPLLKVQEVAVRPRWGGRLEITVERATLSIVKTGETSWNPAFFSRLGDVPFRTIGEITRVVRKLGRDVTLHIDDSGVNWMDDAGAITAVVSGVSFDATPVDVPGRRMSHFKLSIYSSMLPGGVEAGDVDREWMSSESRDYIEIHRGGKPTPDQGFWKTEP